MVKRSKQFIQTTKEPDQLEQEVDAMINRFYADKDLIPQGYRPPVDVAIDDIGIKITIGGVTVTIKAKDADVLVDDTEVVVQGHLVEVTEQ